MEDLVVTNTILASNSPENCNPSTGFSNGGHDLSYPDGTCPGTNGDPKLELLQNNGGPTKSLALGPGSAAIDQVPTGPDCAATDQRGVPRPQGPACDIGAFEVAPLPTCQPIGVTTGEASPVVVPLNCHNPAGAPVTYMPDSNPAHGSLSALNSSAGQVTYTPAAGYVGGDRFSYHATAANGTATSQTVSITVNPSPLCQSQSATTHAGASVTIQLSCSDATGAAVTYVLVSSPAHGSLSALNSSTGQVTYAPKAGYTGGDSFTFHATSANGTAPDQTLTITVNPAGGGQPPTMINARLLRSRFRVAAAPTAITARKAPRGTSFLFTLSGMARLQITITRQAPGVRSRRGCVAPTRKLARARAKHCTRTITLGTLTRANEPQGPDSVPFTGRIGRRALAPGAYRAVLRATNPHGASLPVTLLFTVVH
jgi:hypothetical protein